MRYIACGFTANIDLIGKINESFYKKVEVFSSKSPKSIINTWQEFCEAICWNIKRGTGAEYIVTDEKILYRLESMLDWKMEIGGTGLQAACAASYAGYRAIVNIPVLSDELEKIVNNITNLEVTYGKRGSIPKHYILEFSDDLGEKGIGRSNRIIFRRLNEFSTDLIASTFVQSIKEKASSVDWFLISGFNAFDTRKDIDAFLQNTISLLNSLENKKPKVHLELASIWSLEEQRKIIKVLRPYIHSIGLNEDEFQEILEIKEDLLSLDDHKLLKVLEEGYRLFRVSNLILHTKQFSLVMSQDNDTTCWNNALENGNKLAFARAVKGKICNRQEIDTLIASSTLNPRGEALKKLTENKKDILVCPSFVGKIVSTIGLGDTFTAGLLAEAP
jgi:ADP-dependent phosphofructokinase/glucokinase